MAVESHCDQKHLQRHEDSDARYWRQVQAVAHGKQAEVKHVPRVRQEGVRVLELVPAKRVLMHGHAGERAAVLRTRAFQTGRGR